MTTCVRTLMTKLVKTCAISCAFVTMSGLAASNAVAYNSALIDPNASASNYADVYAANHNGAKLPLEGVTLRVGLSLYPPFVEVDGDVSDAEGIDVDLVRELQRRTGFKVDGGSYNLMSFNELVQVSHDGGLDIVGGGVCMNAERAKFYNHAGPTYFSRTAVVVNSDSNIKSVEDLKGHSIAGEMGAMLEADLPEGATLDTTKTNFLCFYRVAKKLSDALIIDEPVARSYIESLSNEPLKIAYYVEGSEVPLGILIKRDHPAADVLMKTFNEMLDDGTVERIIHSYPINCSNPQHAQYYHERGLEVDMTKVRKQLAVNQ